MIKILFVSNYSRAVTGFGKNMKNVLRALHCDKEFEVVEAANGCVYGADLKTPWKSYGTYPNDPTTRQKIQSDPIKQRLAEYGSYTIDKIVEDEKPDIIVGIEDVWAFDWVGKKWFENIPVVIWTTLDSTPILQQAFDLAPKVDKFLVWASFAEEAMKKQGVNNVETVHGAIDLSSFKPLSNKEELKDKFGLRDNFVVGFVFKNQLRKSVPNLLEGFKLFQKEHRDAKLLLHTDWVVADNTWDIPRYIKEKNIDPRSILATYICEDCKNYDLKNYSGENIKCNCCGSEKLVTKSNMFGVSEDELNEIYNIMDVYCHPFTSGGQELPIQEAKAAGLVTLVTEYSCGTDNCYPHQGGLPLSWVEYREPFTQFIKATTLPESIYQQLNKVYNEDTTGLIENGINYVKDNFSIDKTVNRLKEIFIDFGECDWDYDFTPDEYNENYQPNESLNDKDYLVDLYKNIFYKNIKPEDPEIDEGLRLIQERGRDVVFNYLKETAIQKNRERRAAETSLEDLLDKKKKDRIAVVLPESAGDVLMANALISNLKRLYPNKDIYFFTKPQYFPMISSHPDIYKLIPFKDGVDNLLFLEGQFQHKGFFEIAFLPHIGCQKVLNYLHNGKQKHQFDIHNYYSGQIFK